MKIVVTAHDADRSAGSAQLLDSPASPVFGRCPTYILVDTDAMEAEAVENPAIGAAGGAGIQAAQFIINLGAQAVVTGSVGPNAFNVLNAAGVSIYIFDGGTVRQAVEAYKEGQLPLSGSATASAHAGMGRGRGGGMGMGRGAAMASSPRPPLATSATRQEEISELKGMAVSLRKQLAEVMERLERLEKESE